MSKKDTGEEIKNENIKKDKKSETDYNALYLECKAQCEEYQAKCEELQAKCEEYLQMAQRERADLDNYKKRNAQLKSVSYSEGVIDSVTQILPVMDNLERALNAAENNSGVEALIEGLKNITKQLSGCLEGLDVAPIEALGKEFDPELHNAVLHTEDDVTPPNTVTEEMQKGYCYKDKVIRHSMVKVTN